MFDTGVNELDGLRTAQGVLRNERSIVVPRLTNSIVANYVSGSHFPVPHKEVEWVGTRSMLLDIESVSASRELVVWTLTYFISYSSSCASMTAVEAPGCSCPSGICGSFIVNDLKSLPRHPCVPHAKRVVYLS